MSSAHVVDDLYQGAVPAILPFLVLERGYSYTAIAGLTLAATVLSSVAQPAFGWWTDRHPRPWLVAAGIGLAGGGIALAGVVSTYVATWIVIALSGLGIAAFHPEAARNARKAAGNSNQGMSLFALGGNAGFDLGSLLTTPVLLWLGLGGTVVLAIPAFVMVWILVTCLTRIIEQPSPTGSANPLPEGTDDWPAFLTLTAVVIMRSVMFFGVTSFIALYVIDRFGARTAVGGAALTTFLVAGAIGTYAGGPGTAAPCTPSADLRGAGRDCAIFPVQRDGDARPGLPADTNRHGQRCHGRTCGQRRWTVQPDDRLDRRQLRAARGHCDPD